MKVIWLFEVARALRTMATAKAWRKLDGLSKEKYIVEVAKCKSMRGLHDSIESTMGRRGFSLYFQEPWLVTKKVLRWCG